jgi:tRNA (cmo5U34)-methyltransferase
VLAVGGALILVEKVLGATARIDTLLCERYLDMKRSAGYSEDEIKRKRLALEGVLVPTTSKWNEDLLRQAGFTEIDCLWRAWNFCAWLAVRPSR